MVQTNSKIWVTFSIEGFHRYPDAPEAVAYLRNEHRHKFNIRATLSVTHDNRELEFHMVLRDLKSVFTEGSFDHQSCEMLAKKILAHLSSTYGLYRTYEVEVNEDGECGAIVTQEYKGEVTYG